MTTKANWIEAGNRDLDDDLAPRVTLIRVSRDTMKNNNYLIVDPASHQAVLVDPAWDIEEIQTALALNQAIMSGILLTHSHFDHIDLAKPLADFYNCPIWMSKQEIEASGFSAKQLIAIDETPWSLGGVRIQPILTPGHTPGCLCYLIGDNLFTGDVLFIEGCGICIDVESAFAMYASLEMLKVRLQPYTHIFPGHTYMRPPGQKFSDVLRYNMYLHFPDKVAFAAYRLRKGQNERTLLGFR